MQKNHNEPEMPSSVFVALVGRPNVGKSSLTNHLVGEKVAIVTQKAQTTRNRITGIITKGPVQYVLLDTPGIHKPRNRLDSRMTQTAAASLKDVDVTLMLFEPTGEFTESELGMVEALRKAGPAIAVINKVDLLNDFAALEARKKQVEEFGIFDAIVTVSAKDGTGCGVPGVMASRTIENERDRRMTIMTTCFIPCGAKMPIIGLIAGAMFGGSSLVAVSAYFIGMAAIICSGIMLKKTKLFAGDPAPFVMELPAYHVPAWGNVLRATWERGWSFIKRAGSVILLATVILWFAQGFGFENGAFGMIEDQDNSILAIVATKVAWIFAPLGFGNWKATVASVTGLIAKENVVGTFGVLYHFGGELSENGDEIWAAVAQDYTALSAYAFMIFNLLCAPCFAAMGAIKREMNNGKWTAFAIGYMCVLAYCAALMVYQLGGLITGEVHFGLFTVVAVVVLAAFIYLLVRPNKYADNNEVKLDTSRI